MKLIKMIRADTNQAKLEFDYEECPELQIQDRILLLFKQRIAWGLAWYTKILLFLLLYYLILFLIF